MADGMSKTVWEALSCDEEIAALALRGYADGIEQTKRRARSALRGAPWHIREAVEKALDQTRLRAAALAERAGDRVDVGRPVLDRGFTGYVAD